ncbi:putative ferric-chelate reductase 1 [Spea bombifrons]|uniref:putative ferric-chelate reductase 1 n=1 Tax=Spea bombifrons TaxID=233779 RepID=UPI00234AE345|nr:putative ferric-chelate reductase 1 [Spea bombifrons]
MDPSLKKCVTTLAVLLFAPYIVAYPNGLVQEACTTMEPNHGVSAQTSKAPYTLQLSKSTYNPGDNITVTLSSNPGATPFKGFMIQARAGNSTTPLGSFQINSPDAQLLTCTTAASAVSHTSDSLKTSVQVTWIAPHTIVPNVQLRATVVQIRSTYWLNVTSENGSQLLTPAKSLILLCTTLLTLTLYRI